MSWNMKDKLADRKQTGKTTPAAIAPIGNAHADAALLEKIENLVTNFRHRYSTKERSRFLSLNIKGNDNYYQTP